MNEELMTKDKDVQYHLRHMELFELYINTLRKRITTQI